MKGSAVRKSLRPEKKPKPETIRQAQTWDATKTHYVRAGLCHKCAAQAAWGHQNGFASIREPCSDCRGLTLPAELIGQHGTRGAKWLGSLDVEADEAAA